MLCLSFSSPNVIIAMKHGHVDSDYTCQCRVSVSDTRHAFDVKCHEVSVLHSINVCISSDFAAYLVVH